MLVKQTTLLLGGFVVCENDGRSDKQVSLNGVYVDSTDKTYGAVFREYLGYTV